MSDGQEIKSWLFWGLPTLFHEITEVSWAFVVLEIQKWLESLVLSGFTFSVFGWTPRGYYQQLPVDCLGSLLQKCTQRYCLLRPCLFTADLSGALCPHTVHWLYQSVL